MSTKILTLTCSEQLELLDDGMRWWFLPPTSKTKHGPWIIEKDGMNIKTGRKHRQIFHNNQPEILVRCRAEKVNAKTVFLRLPNGDLAKYKIGVVFITEEQQEQTTKIVLEQCEDHVKQKYEDDEPFFVKPKDKKDAPGPTTDKVVQSDTP